MVLGPLMDAFRMCELENQLKNMLIKICMLVISTL